MPKLFIMFILIITQPWWAPTAPNAAICLYILTATGYAVLTFLQKPDATLFPMKDVKPAMIFYWAILCGALTNALCEKKIFLSD